MAARAEVGEEVGRAGERGDAEPDQGRGVARVVARCAAIVERAEAHHGHAAPHRGGGALDHRGGVAPA